MHCPSCGTNVVDDSAYCPRCAERLPRENDRVSEKNEQLPAEQTMTTTSDRADAISAKVAKGFFRVGVVIAAFLVIIMKMPIVAKIAFFVILVGFLWVFSVLFVRGGAFFLSWLSLKLCKK